jgi:hypothetical protein
LGSNVWSEVCASLATDFLTPFLFNHLIFHLCLSRFFFMNAYRLFDEKPSEMQGKIDLCNNILFTQ